MAIHIAVGVVIREFIVPFELIPKVGACCCVGVVVVAFCIIRVRMPILMKSDSMLFHIIYVFKIVIKEACDSNLFSHILVHFTISKPFIFRYREINTRAQ